MPLTEEANIPTMTQLSQNTNIFGGVIADGYDSARPVSARFGGEVGNYNSSPSSSYMKN